MSLQVAQWNDILVILQDNFNIWSRGLNPSDYRTSMASQLRQPWMRKHFCYLIYKSNEDLASSCKVYHLEFVAKRQNLRFICLGAVYTQKHLRNRGFATNMLNQVINHYRRNGIDALILYSAIDPSFYESFGFQEIGSYDFLIHLRKQDEPSETIVSAELDEVLQRQGFRTDFDQDTISRLSRYHRRWLSRQPYGIQRSEEYFLFKLGREKYLADHSKHNRTKLNIIFLDSSDTQSAYAVIELALGTMRVLEVIGSEGMRLELWSKLFEVASKLGLARIRGWESAVPDISPGLTTHVSLPSNKSETGRAKIECYERDWGKPMILPLSRNCQRSSELWLSTFPCALLEFDHF